MNLADASDTWRVQEILQDCAKKGECFGLDEFTPDGVFNEKLITSCSYWVARKVSNGDTVAVILAGGSGFCRSPNPKQAAGVIVVLEPFRKQGLGDQLLKLCMIQAQALGYEYVLTDVLASNTAGLALMQKHRFYITGTIPNSCIVRDHGYTDSYLHWKPISISINVNHAFSKL